MKALILQPLIVILVFTSGGSMVYKKQGTKHIGG